MQATKRFKLTLGILSACYIVLGLILLIAPEIARGIICPILGVAAIVCGIIRVVYFFIKRDPGRAFQNDLAVGAVLILGGIYLIAWPLRVWDMMTVVLGFTIVFDSIIKLQYAFELQRLQFKQWWAVMVAALAVTVLGILLVIGVFDGTVLLVFWGITLIVDGVANLATLAMLVFLLKKWEKNPKPKPAPANEAQPEKTPPPLFGDDAPADDRF